MTIPDLLPVILAGGGGTRLWPLSREHYPKQFLALTGEQSLLQQTVTRLDGISAQAPLVICNEEHRFLVAEQLRQLGIGSPRIVLEPVGRNTAPALTVAALEALRGGEDPILLMMPADHVIADPAAFRQALQLGADLAREGELVTFGIVPDRPETGYGYIETGEELSGGARRLLRFVEKPDLETARGYLEGGRHLWNSGIFMMRASVWKRAMERLQPEMLAAAGSAWEGGGRDGDFFRLAREPFTTCPADSVDYAVMERLDEGCGLSAEVVPLEAGWSDVGAWSSLWEISGKDEAGNLLHGDVCAIGSSNSLLHAEHRLLAAIGCRDLVVVETADAVLVAPKERSQEVKQVVEWLKGQGREERLTHRRVYRPWGDYEGIDNGNRYQVKRITVAPGRKLSLQMHHHRAEHWIVVSGTAKVTRGEETFLLSENESTYIPIGVKHRLENPGTIPLEIIEVQSGSYLGEDDIVRFEDDYHRK